MTATPTSGLPAHTAASGRSGRAWRPRRTACGQSRSAEALGGGSPLRRPASHPRRARLWRRRRLTTISSRGASSSRPTTPMSAPTTAIIAAKVDGPSDRRVRSSTTRSSTQGDLLARSTTATIRLAVDAAKAKIATQDATIARIGRQIDAQGAVIAQAAGAGRRRRRRSSRRARPTSQRAALEYDRSQKLAQTNFGSQQRLEQATADRDRTAAALAGARAAAAAAVAALERRQGQSRRAQGRSRSRRSARAANS